MCKLSREWVVCVNDESIICNAHSEVPVCIQASVSMQKISLL